jgi:hypothetical protein
MAIIDLCVIYDPVARSRCEERNLDARSESLGASNHVQ